MTRFQISNRQGLVGKSKENGTPGSKSSAKGEADAEKPKRNKEKNDSDAEDKRQAKNQAKKEKKEKIIRDFTEVGYDSIHNTYPFVSSRLRPADNLQDPK